MDKAEGKKGHSVLKKIGVVVTGRRTKESL